MAADAHTMLLLTDGIAFVAAVFLFIEWRSLREDFLLSFALGFMAIVVGCSLAPLREAGSFAIGIWLSNSMVPLAHLCFLHGASAFAGRPLPRAWFILPFLCSTLMALPGMDHRALALFNALPVALLSLGAAWTLLRRGQANDSETRMLVCTFGIHGGFYAIKALCAFAPGAFVDLSHYAGTMIAVSLFEGVLVEVALAMSIAGALRRRREDNANRLAESDPLTGLLNRRGFEARVGDLLAPGAGAKTVAGTLLLIDVDRFKTVNDRFGHQEGDRLLVLLAEYLQRRAPADAVVGRLGGDEFAIVLARDEVGALLFAQDLCAGFSDSAGLDGHCTLSIGCAAIGADIADLPDAYLHADRALYDAKSEGRNRVGLARPSVAMDLPGERDEGFAFPLAVAS